MSAHSSNLYDHPGPKAILRDRLYNVVFTAGFLALGAWFAYTAYQRGIFDDRWSVLWDPSIAYPTKGQTAGDVWSSLLWTGLVQGTLKAVVIAIPVVAVLAVLIAIARASASRLARGVARVFTEAFRGLPVLLVIFFSLVFFGLEPLLAVVTGLVVYNSAVVAEILRAGIAALPAGQREAGLSIGLTPLQVLLRIQLPQAIRIMLPALISQIVVLLKDTSLGFIIAYVELLTITKRNYNFFGEDTTVVFVTVSAVIYILVNMSLGWIARVVERRLSAGRRALTDTAGEPLAPTGGISASGIGSNTRTGDSAV